ncbi:mycobacterial-type methylenetetrahydrofolate reductase [Mycolicibacterium sp. 050232]|uniref:mycobacterial-type methylenetetrahydrofolate reductase n=1 Tax=Mycolicibacterium sp. 050232 TaxID=3113982 RepID=UPI002E2817E0|nr:mycobacterial-type methylenetetrahydrofolate reductase [Mycolicibacterium sp. 050232]MED5813206.1 mycobacterial-type methylenetetrahydrofolate reductase [Mycolicibacterium sp. 050232]
MPLNTIALELVPPNIDLGVDHAVGEARKVARLAAESGMAGRLGHVMLPAMISEDDDRPIEMKQKMDVLDYWSVIQSELPGIRGLCTQVTSFSDEVSLRDRLTSLGRAGFDGMIFVGVPRTMNDGDGAGIAPTDALAKFDGLVENRGVILIPTRAGESGRFAFKCDKGASFAMTQLLYSDAVVGFLREFARKSDYRPEVLLSFGFVPKVEKRIGLINWLIQDSGNDAVAHEQAFVRNLAASEPAAKRRALVDLYKRVMDGVVDLGFPLSVHFEAPYGVSRPAFDTFAEMLAYWSPHQSKF